MATDDDFWLLLHDMAMGVDSDYEPWAGKADTLAEYFKKYLQLPASSSSKSSS